MMEELKDEVFFVLIALILAYGLYTTIGLALGTEIPVVAVTSGSMEPQLQRGDLIIVQGKQFEDIQRGDIIIYKTQYMNVPIIHRVIDRTETALETKGDDNPDQVKFCVERSYGACQPNERLVQLENGQACVKPARGSCPNGEIVNVEKNITKDQVLGVEAFVIPQVGNIKLIPTCIYWELTGQVPPDSPVC